MCRMELLCFIVCIFVFGASGNEGAEHLRYRILAPQFICSRRDGQVLEESNNTVVRIQTPLGQMTKFVWDVRFKATVELDQRLTLLIWRAVRNLQKKLNRNPDEENTYVIEHSSLVPGVMYIFNITSQSPSGLKGETKQFSITFADGKSNLELEDQVINKQFSILLLGSEVAYTDVDYELEAKVDFCQPTQDYHFYWTIESDSDIEEPLNVSLGIGSKLVIPAGTLVFGNQYRVDCSLIQSSDGEALTKMGLFLTTAQHDLEVYLNYDKITISKNTPLNISSLIINFDTIDPTIDIRWSCIFNNEECSWFDTSTDTPYLEFTAGLSEPGRYKFVLSVATRLTVVSATVIVDVIEPGLPSIMIDPKNRRINEGSSFEVCAEVIGVKPGCSLAWYLLESFSEDGILNNGTDGSEILEQLGEIETIYSMEHVFLNELTDFTNESSSRYVCGSSLATPGSLLLKIECEHIQGFVQLDLTVNKWPEVNKLKVSPETGTALETKFSISTTPASDHDMPIQYTFYAGVLNATEIPLASYQDFFAIECVLPYLEIGVHLWVEVCDVWHACGISEDIILNLNPPNNVSLIYENTLSTIQGHLNRCEYSKAAVAAKVLLITLENIQEDTLIDSLIMYVNDFDLINENCLKSQKDQFCDVLDVPSCHAIN